MLDEFKNYVSNYDITNEKINLKYSHSLRVMELSKKYAKKLGFNTNDIEIATIIGLLHDFGRFEQLRVYNNFSDLQTIDHADYSIEQLFDNGEIYKYTNKEDDYEIIKFAIKNHNKFHIPVTYDERMLMHAKLIRDTDKLDILYLVGKLGHLNFKATDEPISKEIIDSIIKHQSVNREYIKNINDDIATTFAFAFDIYNDICLPELKQNLEYFYNQIDGEKQFKEIYDEVIKYIDNRLMNGENNND